MTATTLALLEARGIAKRYGDALVLELIEASGVDPAMCDERRGRPSDEVRARWRRDHPAASRRPTGHRFWHLVDSIRHLVVSNDDDAPA